MYPHERSLVTRHADEPFVLLGVNCDEELDTLRPVLARQGICWRSWADGGTTGPIAAAWGVHNWPTIYVLDARGVIRFKHIEGQALDEAVDRLLAEVSSRPADRR